MQQDFLVILYQSITKQVTSAVSLVLVKRLKSLSPSAECTIIFILYIRYNHFNCQYINHFDIRDNLFSFAFYYLFYRLSQSSIISAVLPYRYWKS